MFNLGNGALHVKCSGAMHIYLDGVKQNMSLHEGDDSLLAVHFPQLTKLVALSCMSNLDTVHKYLVASTTTGLITDRTWKCSNEAKGTWYSNDFNDTQWKAPVSTQVSDHNKHISNAKMIWVQGEAGQPVTTVYCRRQIGKAYEATHIAVLYIYIYIYIY